MGHAAEALEEQMDNRELGILRDNLKILEESGRVSDLVTINRFVDSLLAHQPSAQQPDDPPHQDQQSSA